MTQRQWLFIEAHDVWMFRDNKAFAAGQAFAARSAFPPNPQTMHGAIRTYILEAHGVRWQEYYNRQIDKALLNLVGAPAYNGQPALPGSLTLRGPFVARQRERQGQEVIERIYPQPQDVLGDSLLSPDQTARFETDKPFPAWLPLKPKGANVRVNKKNDDIVWLDETSFVDYLLNKPPQQTLETGDIFQIESRIGLGMEPHRRAAANHMLYHAEFVRPRPGVGLLVEVDADAVKAGSGVMSLGGEGRVGYFRKVKYTPNDRMAQKGNLKITLLTPAYFSGGWQPIDGNWSHWVGEGQLVSLALDKPLPISGWDIANRVPKPLRHYVAAGSVYFFKNAVWNEVPFTESPDTTFDAGAAGFGCVAVGQW